VPSRLLLDLLVHAQARPVHPPGVVPLAQDLPLRSRQQRKIGDRSVRVGDCSRQERPESLGETLDGRAIEEIGVELEPADQGAAGLVQRQAQVEFGRATGKRHVAQGKPRQIDVCGRSVLQSEHHLEQRCAAEIALRRQLLDQPLERQILVGIGAESPFAHLRQQPTHAGLPGELAAQHQGVDEEPDQRLDLSPVAVGNRRAHQQVRQAGVPAQEDLEQPEKGHEEGCPLLPRQNPQPGRQILAEPQGDGPAAGAMEDGPRPIRGEVQDRGRPGEALPPPGELSREHLAAQPAALPSGEVGVLDRQLRQRRRLPRSESGVERRQLTDQHAHRPAVRDDVMHVDQHHLVRCGKAQHADAQERPLGQIERPGDLGDSQLQSLGLTHRRREICQVHQRQVPRRGRLDDLDGPIGPRLEGGAQRLMTADDLVECGGKRREIERPFQPDHSGNAVACAARLELVQEPEPFLGEGERKRSVAVHLRDRADGLPIRGLDPPRQLGDGRGLEKSA
jgi:hypothetical protein